MKRVTQYLKQQLPNKRSAIASASNAYGTNPNSVGAQTSSENSSENRVLFSDSDFTKSIQNIFDIPVDEVDEVIEDIRAFLNYENFLILAKLSDLERLFSNFTSEKDKQILINHSQSNGPDRINNAEINFLKELRFLGKNISSMMLEKTDMFVVKILYEHRDALKFILGSCDKEFDMGDNKKNKGIGFTPANISSIFSRAGAKLGNAINSLASEESIIGLNKLRDFGFTPTNISSILHGSNAKVGEAINSLASEESIIGLNKLRDLGFTPTNISSILNGTGANVGNAVNSLISEETIAGFKKLRDSGFTPTKILSIFNSSSTRIKKKVTEFLDQKATKPTTIVSFPVANSSQLQSEINALDNRSSVNLMQTSEMPSAKVRTKHNQENKAFSLAKQGRDPKINR